MKQVIPVVAAVLVGVVVAWAVFRIGGFGVGAHERAAARLTSPDVAVRRPAIERWSAPEGEAGVARLFSHWKVMDALRPALLAAPPEAIRDLGESFSGYPQWVEQFPAGHERYVEVLASDPEPAAGAEGLVQVRRFDPERDLERIGNCLEALAGHDDADVRLSALEHASHYLGLNAEPIVAGLLDDPDERVARTAWLHLAVIKPRTGYTARWREAPWRVRQAMLYATALTNPEEVQSILKEAEEDADLLAGLADTAFLLKYLADGNPPGRFVPGSTMDEGVRELAQDARRARWIMEGDSFELLTIPGEE